MKARVRQVRDAEKRKPIYAGAGGMLARAVDAVVGTFAPRLAHEFRKARVRSNALLAFEAARVTETNPAAEPNVGPDTEILDSLPALRSKSRALIRDDAHAASILNIHEECIVGEGIRPKCAATVEETGLTEPQLEEWKKACQNEWKRWAEDDGEADATRVGTFYDLQALALRNSLQDGDSVSHALIETDSIECEMIDADRVESPRNQDTASIRGGIEIDQRGRRLAFHILPQHPGDTFIGSAVWSNTPVRHPVTDSRGFSLMQHVYKRTRAGQTRGVPLLTSALLYNKNLHHYLDSELQSARACASVAYFIKRGVSKSDAEILPVQDSERPQGVSFVEDIGPGVTVEYLNDGEEPVQFAPQHPGQSFDPFVTRVLRAIASSSGLAYEVVARDFGRMNLSSFRGLMREMKRGFALQGRRLIRGFCQPWWANVIRMAVGTGRIAAPPGFLENPKPFLRALWVMPSFGMVDPESDAKASTLMIDANLSDPYTESEARGIDAIETLRRRAAFKRAQREIEEEFGLAEGALDATKPPGTSTPGSMPTEDAPPEDKDPVDDEDTP